MWLEQRAGARRCSGENENTEVKKSGGECEERWPVPKKGEETMQRDG